MHQQLTTTAATPIRISAEHYQVESQSKDRLGRVYDLHFRHELKRWICNCPDKERNGNPRCKHVRRLVAWINEQKATQQRIQAQASAVVEQAFAAQVREDEPEYREYGPALPEPAYFTEANSQLARLEGRMQANECQAALLGDQLAELVKADGASEATIDRWMSAEGEKREALQEELERTQQRLLEMEARHNALLHEMEAVHARLADLAQVQPVRISTQAIMVESKNGIARVAQPQGDEPAVEIKEVHRDGRFVGIEVDGYQVRIAHNMVMGCYCPKGQDKPCEHCKQVEAYLARKRESAPLGDKKPFSLTR